MKIIKGIESDSRKIKEGFIFVALKGTNLDGFNYISHAFNNGSKIICIDKNKIFNCNENLLNNAIILAINNISKFCGLLSSSYYDIPSKKLNIIGITGTNGKTTTTFLLESIFKAANINTGVIGTINYRYNDKIIDSIHTTPIQVDLQKLLSLMHINTVNYVIMEVSSHALDQNRVSGIFFKTVVFTNLSHDHLDYHKTIENYFNAKLKLFTDYTYESAVINIDDTYGKKIWNLINKNKLSYGLSENASVRPINYELSINGITLNCQTPSGNLFIKSKLLGLHNLMNILCAIAVSVINKIPLDIIKIGLENISTIPGRLEYISNDKSVFAYIDYAHTPDGLEKVLQTLTEFKKQKLILVFGCGGDRDKEKRPIMGKIAEKYADLIIITSDNPRSENPISIIKDILKSFNTNKFNHSDSLKKFIIIPDRKLAIQYATLIAKPYDIILVAGKGHENYQIIGNNKIFFSDQEELKNALSLKVNIQLISENYKISEKISNILKPIDGNIIYGNPDNVFIGISTDTRTLEHSNLFIALKGNKFDAHDFILDAVNKQASSIIIDKQYTNRILQLGLSNKDVTIIEVNDTLKALGKLANWYLNKLSIKTIAITGSCGKTTTKEFIHSIISQQYFAHKTLGNFNNLIGLPLTIFKALPIHEYIVLEMGMNKRGEIKNLCQIAKPFISLITTIQPAHLEELEDLNDILNEKRAVYDELQDNGIAIINMDDPYILSISKEINKRKYGYSFNDYKNNNLSINQIVYCKHYKFNPDFTTTANILIDNEEIDVTLNIYGKASLQNSLAAITVGKVLNIPNEKIISALKNITSVIGRFNIHKLKNNTVLIDDSYNANPASMKEAIFNIGTFTTNQKKILIIGDMLELGKYTRLYHEDIGNYVSNFIIHKIFYIGNFYEYFKKTCKYQNLFHFNNVNDFLEYLQNSNFIEELNDSLILVKASNSIGLKHVVNYILNNMK